MKAKLELENELRDIVSRLISQVSIASKQTRPDINLASEDAWIPILREVFQAPRLDNLNRHQKNYPGIDLADTENRVCFQITATTDIEKIKDTISTFVDRKYFNAFDDLYILTLVPRQKTYSQESVDKIIGDCNFSFSTKEHIVDPEIIAGKIVGMRFATQQRLLRELKGIAGDIDARINSVDTQNDVPYVFASNLIPITFPEYIYSAVVDIDNHKVWEAAKEFLPKLPKKRTTRSCLYLSMELAGFTSTQFIFHEGKIFTFANIEEDPAFRGLIDEGTIESISTSEFSNSEFSEYENVFKQLIKTSLQSTLKKDRVLYSRFDRIFYFLPTNDADLDRKVTWKDKRSATRTVFEKIFLSKENNKFYANRHFAFDLTFTSIERNWYGVIYPSWIYTTQHRRTHFNNHKLVSDKKKLEKNHSVRDHVRFIANYLKNLTSEIDEKVKCLSLIEFEFNHSEIVDLSEERNETETEDEV